MTFKSSGAITLSTSDTVLATCPAATEYGIKLSLANLTSAVRKYTLKHYKQSTGTTAVLAQDVPLAANVPGTFVWTLALEPGDILYGASDQATSIAAFCAITNADTSGGTSALVPRGAWSSTATYAVNEYVNYNGSSYVSLLTGNLNKQPDTQTAWWMLLALKGDTGATGATGSTGSTGPTGPANVLSIGTIATGAAGSSASATITGTAPTQTLNLTVPRGDTGVSGSGTGDVIGPASAVLNQVALFADTSGKLLKAGVVLASVATSGDAADLTGTLNAARLPSSGATAATYGQTGANVAQITVDSAGRITSVTDRALTAANLSALALSGGTMTGKITLVASASGGAGINFGAGAAPTSPSNGDAWAVTGGFYVQYGGATHQLAPLDGPTFTNAPAGPTAAPGTNTTQLATTAFVQAALPVKAAGSDVYGATEDTKFVTSKALADAAAEQTLTDGATVSWNMANGFNAKVTLGANRTLATPTNPKLGLTYDLRIIQPSSGGPFTLTLPSSSIFDFGGAGTPTLSTGASKDDVLSLKCVDATTPRFKAWFTKGS